MSIRSVGGARTVQPETALPIVYRTLSIEVDERQLQQQAELKKTKEKAAVGEYVFPKDFTHHVLTSTYRCGWPGLAYFGDPKPVRTSVCGQ